MQTFRDGKNLTRKPRNITEMQTVKPLSSPALIRPLLHVCFEPIKGHGQELLRGILTLRASARGEIKDTLRCDLSPGRVAVQGNSFVQGGLKTPFPHTKVEGPVFAPPRREVIFFRTGSENYFRPSKLNGETGI